MNLSYSICNGCDENRDEYRKEISELKTKLAKSNEKINELEKLILDIQAHFDREIGAVYENIHPDYE